MNHVANGTSGHVGKAYVCGECGKNFDEEFDVTSHIITKHICKYCMTIIIFSLLCLLCMLSAGVLRRYISPLCCLPFSIL